MPGDVGVVRENFVSESELSIFEKVSDYDVSLLVSGSHSYDGLPTKCLTSPASAGHDLPKHVLQVLSSLVLGSGTYMQGLVDELRPYDIVHTVETFHGFSEQAVEAKRKHGCAVVCTVWENIPYFCEEPHYSRTLRERLKHPNATRIKQRVREEVDLFLPVTRQAAEALRIEGVNDDRIRVVPVGVDPERFRPGRLGEVERHPAEFGLAGQEAVDVVFVGRYTQTKGVYDLLSAWKRVTRCAEEPVRLTLIGGGDERERVKRFAEHADVQDVTIRGPVPYEDVPLVFDAADIAVLPSLPAKHWQEQYGRVILEAQACGTPVVASETGGIPDAMGGVGELVQPGEPLAISEALLALIEGKEKRQSVGKAGRKRIVESRTLKHSAREIAEAYSQLC